MPWRRWAGSTITIVVATVMMTAGVGSITRADQATIRRMAKVNTTLRTALTIIHDQHMPVEAASPGTAAARGK